MTPNRKILLAMALLAAIPFLAPAPVVFALTDADIATLSIDTPVSQGETISPQPPNLGRIVTQLFLALAVVFGLMWAAVWLARRAMPELKNKGKGAPIQIVATRSIGTRRSLLLVRVQGRTLLLGATPNSIQTLSEFESDAGSWRDTAWETGLAAAVSPVSAIKSRAGGDQ